jgi:phosphoglycerol transferase MdoB-like AlkP superfamily enzyme
MTLLKLLIKRLLLVYGIYFLCRIVFCALNFSHFSGISFGNIAAAFVYGVRFDTTAIMYTNGIIILLHLLPVPGKQSRLYQQILLGLFLVINTITLLLNLSDAGYFPFSGKRSGVELFAMKDDIAGLGFAYIRDYWYLALLLAGTVWLMYRAYPRLPYEDQSPYRLNTFLQELGILIVSCGVCFIAARGTTGLKPLNVLDAARLTQPELAALTLNTPFQMIMTVQQTGVQEKHFMSDEEARKLFNPVHKGASPGQPRRNIVVIIVESLGREYVGYYNNGKGYTPFLDSLMQYSTVYKNAYANGKRSIEGIPSILASMPSLMDNDYMNSYYQTNTLRSTGSYLQEIGYNTSFYHGGKNGTMSFDNFVAVTNSGTYYGLNEYPDKSDNDGNWGIYDEPYLQYFAQELSRKPQPFYAALFTLSSHHPYSIPANRQGMFEEGTLPIHKTVRYTDFALKHFFETARTQSWYDSTVFIITADHSSNNEREEYNSLEGIYRIPLIIFDPCDMRHREITRTIQQLDIMPGILEYAGYDKPFFSFGSHLPGFAIQYVNGQYQLIRHPYILRFDGERTTSFEIINEQGKIGPSTDQAVKAEMELLVKAIIQQYNNALIHNKTGIGN